MIYQPDTILQAAARCIEAPDVDSALDERIRRDLQQNDWQNGRVDAGLLPVYDLLRTKGWPEGAAERDELCQRFGCSSRQLYQWRRDVLFTFIVAFYDHLLHTGLHT